jgi:hypothetical protein
VNRLLTESEQAALQKALAAKNACTASAVEKLALELVHPEDNRVITEEWLRQAGGEEIGKNHSSLLFEFAAEFDAAVLVIFYRNGSPCEVSIRHGSATECWPFEVGHRAQLRGLCNQAGVHLER